MANWPHLPAPPSVGTGAGRQARTMKIKVSFPRRRESRIISKKWIPAFAEILLRVIILQLVRFPSVNRDEVIILHDGASPANNEN